MKIYFYFGYAKFITNLINFLLFLLISFSFFFPQDRRNFVRAPPPGVDFQFDYEASFKIALATLAEDPNLEKMRFELVPKV